MTALLVFTNCPDHASAERIARSVLEERLAACVNILAGSHSLYRWQGAIESASEVPVLLKTTEARYPALAARIAELHPYSVPEIIALTVADGLPAYLEWITAETREH